MRSPRAAGGAAGGAPRMPRAEREGDGASYERGVGVVMRTGGRQTPPAVRATPPHRLAVPAAVGSTG